MPFLTPSEVRSLLALRLVPGIGPRLTAALLEHFGSANAVLRATPEELRQVPHLGGKVASELAQAFHSPNVDSEEALVAKHGVTLLAKSSPDYPESLRQIPDPPSMLYLRGSLEARDANAIAIVGSRKFTNYGRRIAERLASDLARAGITIVSGLARGIDGIAHRAALQAGGRTLAVLANGMSRIYPPEHTELAAQVAASGAILSEAPMAMAPLAELFPGRNRIISGLCRGVIIVEAAEASGTLITAKHAGEQNRLVFAVPGPIDSEASAGCHSLIREGAILIRSAADVLEELDGVRPTPTPPETQPPPELDGPQRQVWDFLANGPRHHDEMVQGLSIPVALLSNLLLTMEMKKCVRRLPGNRYERR